MQKEQHRNWTSQETTELFRAILKLKSVSEAEKFFRDLCTIQEIQEMAKRWHTAQLLDKEKPYREIAEETGLSTATITRIAYWLRYGMGGYRLLLDRLKE